MSPTVAGRDWYKATGPAARWLFRTGAAAAADWDAVHVCVTGYLANATRALPTADNRAVSVLAGWNPDQTWWLSDILEPATSQPESWQRIVDPAPSWSRASQ